METKKLGTYYLIDKLFSIVSTFLVPITTIECEFSYIKVVKIIFRNKMEDEFLSNNLVYCLH
jgi:hypothetical protein